MADPNNSSNAASLVNDGNRLREQGRIAEAEVQYRAALRVDSTVALGHCGLAMCLAERGAVDEAKMHFRTALEADSSSPNARINFAKLLYEQDEYPEAARVLFRCLDLAPNEPEVHLLWALIIRNVGLLDFPLGGTPEHHFKRAIALAPQDARMHTSYAMFLAMEGRLGEADYHFREALRVNPGDPIAQEAYRHFRGR